ncbi:thiamine phosphate synthase [Cellulophaga sp. E16_2]|uniref:Thiamine-phosphate synthase n=1 Tax=Cellulophaga algicola (strain DSM 14237 / IC166 / ACAM 630) TaxID=688270 RepID=E6XB98_CELAD|nr:MULTISPECIES: thiamine phosphate synthase [Cellulophaga]ADV49962.1 thiamine-phosphate diphosphorylase [Cellulophaga algicola DSM 14237]MBO0592336.1 thiamine phosphate synthase [Cellulophaga sp. E16_2]
MQLPNLHYISQGETPQEHLKNIKSACTAGATLVQLRLKNLSPKKVLKFASEAKEITDHYQTRLIINDHYRIAKEVKADGVHLGRTDTCPSIARKYLESWQIIGGTANTISDCNALIAKNVDYIGVGPYHFTKTKESLSPILGLEGYAAILEKLKTTIPIIAVGGITVTDVPEILKTGVYGVAVATAITKDFNTITLFKKILEKSDIEEQVWKPKQTV